MSEVVKEADTQKLMPRRYFGPVSQSARACMECNGGRIIKCPGGIDACRRCAQLAEIEYQGIKNG